MEKVYFAMPSICGGYLVVAGYLTGKSYEVLHEVSHNGQTYLVNPALIAPTQSLCHASVAQWHERQANYHYFKSKNL